MQFTQRQRSLWRRWRPILGTILMGLFLGFAGPFGSYPALPTATRYTFWLGLAAAGGLAAVAADALLPRTKLPASALRIGAVALLSALPMTFVVAWTMSLVQPGRVYAPLQLPALFTSVAAVQLLVVYVTTAGSAKTEDAVASEPAPHFPQSKEAENPAAFPSALLSRIPPAIGRQILAIETEDHYIRVYAIGGNALILMRMADVVALLDPRLGAQVHRRWWVAQAAVAGLRVEGQKMSLCLIDNSNVPVGRTFAAATRARFGNGCNISPIRQT